jgi:1-acyl-sn-glycerol-3-phosphate acyltransferase
MSNHLSFLDGPLLYFVIPQPILVILKKEIFRIPIIGLGMKQVGFVPVDRKSIRGGKKSIDHAVRLMEEKGYSFLIFPEGTRSRTGKLQEFRRGGFFLAQASQSAIVPISIQGTYELMPKGRFFVKKGAIKVSFHPPVSVQGNQRDDLPVLLEEVRSVIRSGLAEDEKDRVP